MSVYMLETMQNMLDEINRLKAELDSRPIVWAIQNIETQELSDRGDSWEIGGSVDLYKSEEDAKHHILQDFFKPSDWHAVVYTGDKK